MVNNVIFYKYPGTIINLTLVREGEIIKQNVTLASRPSDEELYGNYLNENEDYDKLGLKVELNDEGKIKVKEVKENSSAEDESIEPNDIITHIDDKIIENIEDYYESINNLESGDIALIGVTTINQSSYFSQTYSRYIAIKVD